MQAFENRLQHADVVAAFEYQTDAEKAINQLRQAGFQNKHIGYFVWHPLEGLKSLFDRNYARECALAGAVLGAVFGVWVAPALSARLVSVLHPHGVLELALLCVVCTSLFFGFVGREIGIHIHERGAEVPVVDPEAGPFILTVSAGEDSEWVWSVIRRHHGYEPRHAAPAHPSPI